jgi:hypothetical protein
VSTITATVFNTIPKTPHIVIFNHIFKTVVALLDGSRVLAEFNQPVRWVLPDKFKTLQNSWDNRLGVDLLPDDDENILWELVKSIHGCMCEG